MMIMRFEISVNLVSSFTKGIILKASFVFWDFSKTKRWYDAMTFLPQNNREVKYSILKSYYY